MKTFPLANNEKRAMKALVAALKATDKVTGAGGYRPRTACQERFVAAVRRSYSLCASICGLVRLNARWDAGVLMRSFIDLGITMIWMGADDSRRTQLDADGNDQLRRLLGAKKRTYNKLSKGEQAVLDSLDAINDRELACAKAKTTPKACGCKQKVFRLDLPPNIGTRASEGSPEGDDLQAVYDLPFRYWSAVTHSSFWVLRIDLEDREHAYCDDVIADAAIMYAGIMLTAAKVLELPAMKDIGDRLNGEIQTWPAFKKKRKTGSARTRTPRKKRALAKATSA
ncbi:MAG: hypothetical protein IT381_26000 [Deltaproteobacteria bacterium]|nr:hypothetical protein [Deltaproteobacteria bacterium]